MNRELLISNYKNVQESISSSVKKIQEPQNKVTLIAVSKTKPIVMLQDLYDAGCREFGENKVQELLEKYESLPKDIHWHMIGHLQTNKVKYIVDKVSLIHSVDSLKLAQEISKQAQKKEVTVAILIEVNIALEDSKFGTNCDETRSLIREIAILPNISIKGLMTVAPYVDNPEENRQYFVKMKQLSVDIMHENIDNVSMNVLSMGMTGDYQIAVEEGATLVRVGTGIFGERNYNIVNKETM